MERWIPEGGSCGENRYLHDEELVGLCRRLGGYGWYLPEGYPVPRVKFSKCHNINDFADGSSEGFEVWLRTKIDEQRLCATVKSFGVNE